MTMIEFTSNHTDHSNDTGFQFEFHCDKCGNGHMSAFLASKVGVATGFLRAASALFGSSALSRAAQAGDYAKDSLRGKARDDAFAAAVAEGKKHFKKCSRCGKWVCPETCWNAERGLCEECAPDLQEEVAAAQAAAAKDQVWEKARLVDQTDGLDLAQKKAAFCPHCGAKAGPGKFCGECGKALHAKTECPACHAKLSPGAKFCGECGGKV
jgi:hypothetical protein